MTTDEAREAAWREFWATYGSTSVPRARVDEWRTAHARAWNARARYDEQRIAALVDGLDTVRNALWRYLGGRSARAAAINRAFDASMRALGQSEEVKP